MAYAVVTGRSADGPQYASYMGWVYDVREALLFDMPEAVKWAELLEAKQALTRQPDDGVYQIKAIEMQPHVYTVQELLDREAEDAQMDALFEAQGL